MLFKGVKAIGQSIKLGSGTDAKGEGVQRLSVKMYLCLTTTIAYGQKYYL